MKLFIIVFLTIFLFNETSYGQHEVTKSIVDFPDIEAEAIGGIISIKEQLLQLVSYPESIEDIEHCRRIHLIFTIEKNGTVSEIKQKKNQCNTLLDVKAVSALIGKELFHPAYHLDKPVRTKIVLPITICFLGN